MTSRCNSNPAQYERNRRFGHLVHALGRAAGGAKPPSVGLCLNASKAESYLVGADIHFESRGPSHEPVAAYHKWTARLIVTVSVTVRGFTRVDPSGNSMLGLGIVCRRLWYERFQPNLKGVHICLELLNQSVH
ncbi:hypothetical protein J6590_091320 [Homalodisca vitripennis]|nr:hypothetical protein J6590_091320 [Homalodisca vitripennis]